MKESKFNPIRFEITSNFHCESIKHWNKIWFKPTSLRQMVVSTYAEKNFTFLASRLLVKWSVSVIGWSIQELGDLQHMSHVTWLLRSMFVNKHCKKLYFEALFERRTRSQLRTKSGSKMKLRNLDKEILFHIDGYFDFDDKQWKTGRRSIRRVSEGLLKWKNQYCIFIGKISV